MFIVFRRGIQFTLSEKAPFALQESRYCRNADAEGDFLQPEIFHLTRILSVQKGQIQILTQAARSTEEVYRVSKLWKGSSEPFSLSAERVLQ